MGLTPRSPLNVAHDPWPSTTVVTNPEAQLPASCSDSAARTPRGLAATPTNPGPHRALEDAPTAAAPAADGLPERSARSTPARRQTFFGWPFGQIPDGRQGRLRKQ